jgi:hypothetical protein
MHGHDCGGTVDEGFEILELSQLCTVCLSGPQVVNLPPDLSYRPRVTPILLLSGNGWTCSKASVLIMTRGSHERRPPGRECM